MKILDFFLLWVTFAFLDPDRIQQLKLVRIHADPDPKPCWQDNDQIENQAEVEVLFDFLHRLSYFSKLSYSSTRFTLGFTNYIDTKEKSSYTVKKLTCKGTLRHVFISLMPIPHTPPPLYTVVYV